MRPLLPAAALALTLAACEPSNTPDAGGSSCATPSGSGKTRTLTVSAAETWAAADSPHVINGDMSINAPVTIEPCAIVTIAADKTITVNTGGSITASGTAARPVRITSVTGAANWASIRLIGGTAHLAWTSLENGGAPLNIIPDTQGTLDVRSGQSLPTAPDLIAFVDHVVISSSKTQGVYAHSGGDCTANSTNLIVTGSEGHAATFDGNVAGTLPSGTYTGNAFDDILLTDVGIRWDITLRNRGVPYNSSLSNGAGVANFGAISGLATLFIEPGVHWKFKKGSGLLQLDTGTAPSRAVLVARGQPGKEIVFTSADPNPAPGDWLGIWMGGDSANNVLDHVRIEYAGKLQTASGSSACQSVQQGTTHNGGALRIYNTPPSTLISNSTIADSATNGIDRGWRSDTMPSFLSSNTFTNVALCNQTQPQDMSGGCPTPVPCPK